MDISEKELDNYIKEHWGYMSNDTIREIKFQVYIKNKIVDRRHELDMTQDMLAHEAGVNRVTIARLESLKQFPSLSTLLRILNALNLKLEVTPFK